MAFTIEDLIEDERLGRLFSEEDGNCALQLWILQLKVNGSVESRVLYGWLLPFHRSSSKWTMPSNDDFKPLGSSHAQILRLNLYLDSKIAADLLRSVCRGDTLSQLSEELGLEIPASHLKRIGPISFGQSLIYRPTVYLPNRSAIGSAAHLSQHESAGAFSAAISDSEKDRLFCINAHYDPELAHYIVKCLNVETGLDFAGKDLSRLGELELLVFPTLDDYGRELLAASWKEKSNLFRVALKICSPRRFESFSVRLDVTCGGQLAYSSTAICTIAAGDEIACEFSVPEKLRRIVDGTEIEIHGFDTSESKIGTLFCRWSAGYFREISFAGTVVNQQTSKVRLRWLEKVTTSKVMAQRLDGVQTVWPSRDQFTRTVGDRAGDRWVHVNRKLHSCWSRLVPAKSEGRFFDELVDGNGSGRLDFAEWFKDQLHKHRDHQIILFDPYFESAGIGLVVPNTGFRGDYTIFTTLPESDKDTQPGAKSRIDNLLAACTVLRPHLKGKTLRVYALKYRAFHDRYFLVMRQDGSPVAGFNFSNSIQSANENYPFLITPIPDDVMVKVSDYARKLVSKASENSSDVSGALIFDSTAQLDMSTNHQMPLAFLDDVNAGTVLAASTGEQSLGYLAGDELRQELTRLGFLSERSARFPATPGLRGWIGLDIVDYQSFRPIWLLAGEVIAHMSYGTWYRDDDVAEADTFKRHLTTFLYESFDRIFTGDTSSLEGVLSESYLAKPLKQLFSEVRNPAHLFKLNTHSVLTWSEIYAIHILWNSAPRTLFNVVESGVSKLPAEVKHETHVVGLAVMSEVARLASLGVEFGLSSEQHASLIGSSCRLLNLLGIHSLLGSLRREKDARPIGEYAQGLEHQERFEVLGWFTQQLVREQKDRPLYDSLVQLLMDAMPANATSADLTLITDSLRGYMPGLGWSEPWLFRDIVYPLIERGRVSVDDVCEIWLKEVRTSFNENFSDKSMHFRCDVEGRLLEIGAWSLGNSAATTQMRELREIRAALKRLRPLIERPLASTLDWDAWNKSLTLMVWILALTNLTSKYLVRPSQNESEVMDIQSEARRLVLFRPINEWRAGWRAQPGGLIEFVDDMWERNYG